MEKKILLAILTAFILINISFISSATDIYNCSQLTGGSPYVLQNDIYSNVENENIYRCWWDFGTNVIDGNNKILYMVDDPLGASALINEYISGDGTLKNLIINATSDFESSGIYLQSTNLDHTFQNLIFQNIKYPFYSSNTFRFIFYNISIYGVNGIGFNTDGFYDTNITDMTISGEGTFINIGYSTSSSITNLRLIDATGDGEIIFYNIVMDGDGIPNLNSSIMQNNNFTIDETTYPVLNVSSHVKMNNIALYNPEIYRNGVLCPEDICTNFVYSNGVAEFDVSSWGSYQLEGKILITNCTDLQNMDNDWEGDYILSNNIDCSDTINWNGGDGFSPISTGYDFIGSFDGAGYNITNLYINRPLLDGVGLFSRCKYNEIKNIGLINVTIISGEVSGAICGESQEENFTNVFSTGSIDSSTDISVIGGLIGWGIQSTITNSYSSVNIIQTYGYSGGLVGGITDSSISNSYATGDILNCAVEICGGFIGYVEGASFINNSYSTGSVTGGDTTGGFVGFTEADIYNSYSTGFVNSSGSFVGGFAGDKDISVGDNGCFWDTETSGQATSSVGTGKTTAEMQTESTFTGDGWDFVNVWQIGTNVYPTLQVFGLLPEAPVEETITEEGNFIQGQGNIYAVMKSSGAGLGKFIQYMSLTLPFLVIGLMIVGIIIVIGLAIKSIIVNNSKMGGK